MNTAQQQFFQHLTNLQVTLSNSWLDYWRHYSNVGTWQFWLTAALLIVPLILLYFLMDRSRALRLGFFGFNVHVWFTYIDSLGAAWGLWNYPYKVIPFFPTSFSLDVSLVPVVLMLTYQWTINHGRNYYLYATGVCILFVFIFKPILSWLDLFEMYKWMNYLYLFIGYLLVMLVSKWITNLFVHFESEGNPETSHVQ